MKTNTASANQLWFLNSLVTVHVSESDGRDGISILEHRLSYGDSPPYHRHLREDEVFHILEGEFRLKLNDQELRGGPGDVLMLPKGVPHTYRVESQSGGRILTTTVHGDFERFVRAMSRPAERPEIPERAPPPSEEAMLGFRATAAQFGIEFVGPPLS